VDTGLDSLRRIEAYLISAGFMTSIEPVSVSIQPHDPAAPSITTVWRLTWYSMSQQKLVESGKMSVATGAEGETQYTLESGGFPVDSLGS
jgi:hypothetical protein